MLTCLLQGWGSKSSINRASIAYDPFSHIHARAGCSLLPRCSALSGKYTESLEHSLASASPCQYKYLKGIGFTPGGHAKIGVEADLEGYKSFPGNQSQVRSHCIHPGLGTPAVVGFTPQPENVKGRMWICFPSVGKDGEVEIQRG